MPVFYGAVDRKRDPKTGVEKISSQYPAWTFPRQIENLEESIAQKKRAIEQGFVDPVNAGEHRINIEKEETRLREILESKPVLSADDTDACNKVHKELAKEIQRTMPSYTQMQKGQIDGHYEHNINSKPCIQVSPKAAEIAEENGIRIASDRKLSREAASKLYKLCGFAIGENTNVERLRSDGYNRSGSTPRR